MAKEIIKAQGKKNVIVMLSEHVNKRGELRGKDKKETKTLKSMCVHHRLNKKGKVKPRIGVDNGRCTCEMCGHKFGTRILKHDDVRKIVKPLVELVDQSKYMTVAGDLGDEATNYFCKLAVELDKFPKAYGKVADAVQKKDSVKKKKNKNRKGHGGSGSSSYGSWG